MKKILLIIFICSFIISGVVYAAHLKLNLKKLHFGAQSPSDSSMPANLELARPWIFNWNNIEKEEGTFDWSDVDDQYKEMQKDGYAVLGVIIPFAEWDQKTCRSEACLTSYEGKDKVGLNYVCNPCQEDKYKKFVRKLGERYDGDGYKDMKGLTKPIKAWEVWNEPEFENYYIGDASDYAHLLKMTYNQIKKVNPKAKVINGGMASMGDDSKNFWTKVFNNKNNGANYLDAVSLHCIGCSAENTLNIKQYNEWAAGKNIANKPIWLTEWEMGNLTDDEASILLTEGLAYGFAHNVSKVFMVEFAYSLADFTKTKAAYGLMQEKLEGFNSAAVNTEFEGADGGIDLGVYEFYKDTGTVLVAWGSGTLTLGGAVSSAVDIYGNDVAITDNVVALTDTPYIIEF